MIIKQISPYFLTVAVLFTLSLVFTGGATAQTRQLPVSFYTDLVTGPSAGVGSWIDPISGNVLQIDQLGKRNVQFGLGLPTTVDGRVTIQTLRNGMESVTVTVNTNNALCWGRTYVESQHAFLPAFGYSPAGVAAHIGPPSLGNSILHIVYSPQPAGHFNPNGAYFDSVWATIECDGQLRSESGVFVAGTRGLAQTTQVWLVNTGVPSGCPPEGDSDCFPAEKVQFRRIGQ